MPHRCVRCGKIYYTASQEILTGCSECGGKFFFFIKDEQLEKLKEEPILLLPQADRQQIEKDVREMVGAVDEETPVVLDLESIRIIGEGKFELDIVKLFNKKVPLIYKLEEGKYIIDLASTLQRSAADIKEIRDPEKKDD